MDHIEARKLALRDQLVTDRGRLGVATLVERARAISASALDVEEIRRAATVAAYVSVGREPGTGILLDALRDAGKRVIVPLLQPDNDLDWAVYDSPASLAPAGRGLLEPVTPALGAAAIATADAVLVPGLAVDRTGLRMGRGGGSYDRALTRVPRGTFVAVVLNASEILDEVPAAPHDRRVGAAITENGVIRFSSERPEP